MREQAAEIMRVAAEARAELDAVVLLGMGGSSLAPEVLVQSFGVEGFHVLDTTHPEAIRRLEAQLDLAADALRVGVEVGLDDRDALAHGLLLGEGAARVAVDRDHRSRARSSRRWRASAGSAPSSRASRRSAGATRRCRPFGMVPAALMGIDLVRLLDGAIEMADACRGAEGNRGLELGLGWGEGWKEGRDKICIQGGGAFGLWAEQLDRRVDRQAGEGTRPGAGRAGRGRRPSDERASS